MFNISKSAVQNAMKKVWKTFWKLFVRTLLGVIVLLALWFLGASILPVSFQEKMVETLGKAREYLIENHPSLYANQKSYYDGKHSWYLADAAADKSSVIMLVHGLDEPGPIWNDLIPVLNAEGYNVYKFIYPNDLGVQASSELLCDRLEMLRKEGVRRVFLVGHSMGGLVIRNTITDPRFAFFGKVDNDSIPRCLGVVTVGTPNHGSEFAKGRFFAEMRDQAAHIRNGEHGLLGGIFDGSGQAGIDLYPGSAFLTELNARPYPNDSIPMTIVAGVWTDPEVFQKAGFPGAGNDLQWTDKLSEKFGDGVVSLQSAMIPGIADIHVVQANHHDMLHHMRFQSGRIPPAIPIILEKVRILKRASE